MIVIMKMTMLIVMLTRVTAKMKIFSGQEVKLIMAVACRAVQKEDKTGQKSLF